MSRFRFQTLYGGRDEGPTCSLLEIDDVRILLDCGWNELLDVSLLEPLRSVCKDINIVLVSHGDLAHTGALPYAVAHWQLNCKIYATSPAKFLAEQTIRDLYQAKCAEEKFELFGNEDIQKTFRMFDELAYSDSRNFKSNKGSMVRLRPQAAGRTIGGAFWEITNEIDKIIYAVDYNHKKDRHLNRTVLETFTQPTLLITDALSAVDPKIKRQEVDAKFLDSIRSTLGRGGNVLLPVESAGRTFEILVLLDHFVRSHQISSPVIFLDECGANTIERTTRLFRTWMFSQRADSSGDDSAFDLKSIIYCQNIESLKNYNQPKVVLAFSSSLETGPSRILFQQWAGQPRNKIIFTQRGDPGTLARKVRTMEFTKERVFTLQMKSMVPLVGDELLAYRRERELQKEKEERERQLKEEAKLERLDNFYGNSDEEEDDEPQSNRQKKTKKGIPVWMQFRQKKMYFSAIRRLDAENPMFSFEEIKTTSDDYGEIISLDRFQETQPEIPLPEPLLPDEPEEDEAVKEEEIPKKAFIETCQVFVDCCVEFVNLEGRSDGESIRSILTNLKPKSVILFHGKPRAVNDLQQYMQALTIDRRGEKINLPVYAPNPGTVAEFSSDMTGYKITLSDEVIADVQFTKANDCEIGWVTGSLRPDAQTPVASLLTLVSTGEARSAKAPRGNLLVGEKSLAEIKELVEKNGFKVELDSGVLMCNGHVKIQKTHPSTINIEGILCQDYFDIRKLVYGQFSVI